MREGENVPCARENIAHAKENIKHLRENVACVRKSSHTEGTMYHVRERMSHK